MSEHACTLPALGARFKVQLADNRQPQTFKQHDVQTPLLYSAHLKAALTFLWRRRGSRCDGRPHRDASTDDVPPLRSPGHKERLNQWQISASTLAEERTRKLQMFQLAPVKCCISSYFIWILLFSTNLQLRFRCCCCCRHYALCVY